MKRDELGDLSAFLAVVEAGNFTRAAATIGSSQSALSHTVQRLETRLGVRLLNRTTRRVAPTDAGERLAATLRPSYDAIETEIALLRAMRDKPSGSIRITASALAARTLLWPAVSELVAQYPDLKVEIHVESRFTDIVTERFDAGVRLGESIDRDMIAVRIGPDMRMALIGAPAYLARKGTPRSPQELVHHDCINLRLATMGNLYAWEFEKAGRPLNVRVDGPLVLSDPELCLKAALDGLGLAFLPEDYVLGLVSDGRLARALEDWCPPFPGYHLYYPSRRQQSPALAALVEKLRWRG